MSNKIFDKIDGFIVNNRETLSLLARNLTIVFVFCLALQIFGLVSVNQYLNLNWLAFGVFSIDTIALIYYFRTLHKLDIQMFEQRHKILNEFFKYGFLVLLGFVTLTQFFKFEWAKEYNIILTIITVFFGVITFYQNKEVIERVEEEATQEQIEEERRKQEFPSKFPGISKVPVFRSLVKWMYKEGWWYSVGLVGILILGLFLRLANLENLSLWGDEFITKTVAESLLEHRLPQLPSGIPYYRSIPFIVMSVVSMLIFESKTFAIRFFPAIFGGITIIVTYYLSKIISKKYIAIISSLIIAVNAFMVDWSRQARMYSFLTLMVVYTVYFIIKNDQKIQNLALIGITSLINLLGISTLIIYILRRVNIKNFRIIPKKNILVGFILSIGSLIFILFFSKLSFIDFFIRSDYQSSWDFYLKLIDSIFGPSIILLYVCIAFYLFRDKLSTNKLYALYFILCIAVLSISTRKTERYIIFLIPFVIILIAFTLGVLVNLINLKKVYYYIILGFFCFAIIYNNNGFYVPNQTHGYTYSGLYISDWKSIGIPSYSAVLSTNSMLSLNYVNAKEMYLLRSTNLLPISFMGNISKEEFTGQQIVSSNGNFVNLINQKRNENIPTFVIIEANRKNFISQDILNTLSKEFKIYNTSDTITTYQLKN